MTYISLNFILLALQFISLGFNFLLVLRNVWMNMIFGRVKRNILIVWGGIFLGLVLMLNVSASKETNFFLQKTDYRQVLVVFSYDLSNYASLEKYAQILEIFDEVEGVNFSFEFFDAAKTNLLDYTALKAEVLYNKYHSLLPFDLILVFDDEALLLIKDFSEFDDRSPIFYSGIENVSLLDEFDEDVELFGFDEYLGIFETTELAKTLLPDANMIYFLFDQSIEAQFYMGEIEKNQNFFDALGLTTVFVESREKSFSDVADWLSYLPDDTIVLFHSFNKDVNDDYLNNDNLFSYFSSVSDVPIFTLFTPINGLLGGYVTLEREEATTVAEYAIKFLNGESVSKIITHNIIDKQQYVIDEQVFNKYNLDRDLLPDEVVFVNKGNSLFEVTPQQVNVLLVLFVVLLYFIFDSQIRYSSSTNKLLQIEKISLLVKNLFNELGFDLAIEETLKLLNEKFETFLSIYALLNEEEGKFEVIKMSDHSISSVDHFLDNCRVVDYPDVQENICNKNVFVSKSKKDLKFYSLDGQTNRARIKSCLFIPIELHKKECHYIILLSKSRKLRLPKKELASYNMLANILSVGIMNSYLEKSESELVHSIFQKNQEMEYILSHSDNMIVSFDQNSRILDMNKRARDILGVTTDDLQTLKYADFIHADDLTFSKQLKKDPNFFTGKNNPMKIRTRMRTALYGFRWYEWVVYFFEEEGEVVKRVSIGQDVTATVEREREMEYLLMHDAMTELNNSTYVKQLLKDLPETGSAFCAYMNISSFRQVNESFGHKIGDEFLVRFGERLKETFGKVENACLARVAGDEFVVLVTADDDSVVGMEKKIKDMLLRLNAKPINCSGNLIMFHLTIGYSTYPEMTENALDIYRFAEVAMFESKKSNKRGFQKFEQAIFERQIQQQDVTNEVQRAMVHGEFEMFYQPIQDIQEPNKIYMESLIRWNHPEKGFLTPQYFLDIVESSGQIIEISRLMFEQVCSLLEKQKRKGFIIDSISFNLSVASLRLRGEAEYFIQIMKKHNLLPSQIVIEITESLFFENNFDVNLNLKMFREFGIQVAIDDFGMEYSTLSMLENVEYDVIKLDQHFTKNLGTKNADLIVNMIHELCVYNNKRCIVEGVEEEAQLEILKERGFVEFQGYYYSRPMPSSQLAHFYLKDFA